MEIPLKEVIKEYEKGVPLKEISRKMTTSISMLKSELLRYKGKKGKEILLKELRKENPMINIIIEEYQKGKKVEQLSERYGITKERIYHLIGQYQMITNETILVGNKQGSGNARDDLQIEKIIEGYRNGDPWSKLENDNNASATAIRKRIDRYIEEKGNQIVEERENEINQRKIRTQSQINEIKNRREQGEPFESIASDYNVSATTIQKRLREYRLQTEQVDLNEHNENVETEQANPNGDNENVKTEENSPEIINLNMIINYFRLGYNLDKVQKFAEKKGYHINESDIETARKIENGELKVASEASIAKIIKKYEYSYEKLVKIGKQKGYVITFESYVSGKTYINIKNQEERSKKSLEGEEK